MLHDTRHTAAGKWGSVLSGAPGSSAVLCHAASCDARVWILTVRSCPSALFGDQAVQNTSTPPLVVLTSDALAMYIPGSPMLGAHATSRTQLSCSLISSSSTHFLAVSSKPQIRMALSEPPDTNRLAAVTCCCGCPGLGAPLGVARTEGAHETALAPDPCALKITASVEPSSARQLNCPSTP